MSHGSEFSLSTGTSYNKLFFNSSSNKISPNKSTIARCRVSIINKTSLISISIAFNTQPRSPRIQKSNSRTSLQISKYTIDRIQMYNGGAIHKLTHNTYNIGNFRFGKSEVNETSYQTLVPSCINQPVTHINGKAMILRYQSRSRDPKFASAEKERDLVEIQLPQYSKSISVVFNSKFLCQLQFQLRDLHMIITSDNNVININYQGSKKSHTTLLDK